MKVGRILFWVVILAMWGFIGVAEWLKHVDLKPDRQGMIRHPLYGAYPACVKFEQGMMLQPGQTAVSDPDACPR